MNQEQVCGECKLFANEDAFGNGWCEFHQKEAFCENVACEDGIEIMKLTGHRSEQNFFRYIRLTGEDTARSISGDMFFRK